MISAAVRKELHQNWQVAFSEWHRHRTDETAAAEIQARRDFVTLCKQIRRQGRPDAVG